MTGADGKLVAIAPAHGNDTNPSELPANGDVPHSVMAYACQTCAKRKVKCDRATPICARCRKSKLHCTYRAPQPRLRKRELSNDVLERLDRYERILRQHGLLDSEVSPSSGRTPIEKPEAAQWNRSEGSRPGRLLAGHGKSRYIDNHFWRNFGDHEIQGVLDDENDGEEEVEVPVDGLTDRFVADPLTGAFLAISQQSLLQHHPTHTEAMLLWRVHRENVEPLCKILHIPSTTRMLEEASQDPENVSRTNECLLFAIYHFAVFSMTEEECMAQLGLSRGILMERYNFATRQALVNASFLKTTELPVLQALVLFLLSCRFVYDSHTYWILTGVAVRIAQRMGLHRDGETLGLPPFEVQMRRRLFYQLLPLDGNASIMSGTVLSRIPDAWDTQPPLNVDDAQIWPGMTETPKEQKGATELIFCLSRAYIGSFIAKTGELRNSLDSGHGRFKDYHEAELVIARAENEVEEKYIRYCDAVNPLHFLAICSCRSGITAIRLFIRLPKVRNETATDEERRYMLQLAQKLLDTDTAIHAHTSLKKYRWHIRPFFLWGTWDSLVFVLTSLWRSCKTLSPSETDAAWTRIEQIYRNHGELLESKRALYVALGRLALKAWDTHIASNNVPEPAFITTLRSLQQGDPQSHTREGGINTSAENDEADTTTTFDRSPTSNLSMGNLSGELDFDLYNDFNLDGTDWTFWDQLMHNPPVQEDHTGEFP